MTQDKLKRRVGQAAADYILAHAPEGAVIGIGTGSTVNCFIDALAARKAFGSRYRGAVSSSGASTAQLASYGIEVFDLSETETLPVYVDGADEIDPCGCMIKGGGGALTREKIIATAAEVFVCIADVSKRVDTLGHFALPIEIVPFARPVLMRKFAALGAAPTLRTVRNGAPYLTDNGHQIIDVKGLKISDPLAFEAEISAWPGVVTAGLFAKRRADICLLSTEESVEIIQYRAQLFGR